MLCVKLQMKKKAIAQHKPIHRAPKMAHNAEINHRFNVVY
jgi:hypothetical protein